MFASKAVPLFHITIISVKCFECSLVASVLTICDDIIVNIGSIYDCQSLDGTGASPDVA